MAFGASTIFDVRTTGSDTNGVGFDPGATMATDLAATSGNTASPVVTSASYNFISRDVGAWVFIKLGTNWTPGWYQIASVAANAATLTAGVGTAPFFNVASGNFSPIGYNTVAGCATVASPTGGTWSIDYSQGNSAGIAYTDLVIGATNTQFTSAANPVGPHIVGNLIRVTSGTGFTVQTIEVNSVSGTTATCDKAIGTASSTGGVGNLGGCGATPGFAGAFMGSSSGGLMFVKGGTYSFSGTANTAGGPLINNGGSNNLTGKIVGWTTNRILGNTDTRPILNAGADNINMFDESSYVELQNLDINGNGHANIQGVRCNGINTYRRVRCTSVAFGFNIVAGPGHFIQCEAVTCTHGFYWNAPGTAQYYDLCSSRNATASEPAFTLGAVGCRASFCLALNPVGAGYYMSATDCEVFKSVADGPSGTSGNGFVLGAEGCAAIDSIGVNCAVCAFNTRNDSTTTASPVGMIRLESCAGFNNTVANTFKDFVPGLNMFNFVTLTGNPFNVPASLDYTLNGTSGAGAACKGAGFPLSIQGLTGSSSPDIGLFQSVPSAAAPVNMARAFTGF